MRTIMLLLAFLSACAAPPPEPKRDYPDPAALPPRPELPDPLVSFDGKRIESKEAWESLRKPELKALFQHYMYGVLPPVSEVGASVRRTDPKAYGGKATLKEV